ACARAPARVAPLVVVHGGGQAITTWSTRLELPVEKRDGLRVTSPELAELVEMVLAGPVNRQVVAALRAAGLDAVGLSGVDGGLLVARPAPGDLGHGDREPDRRRRRPGRHGGEAPRRQAGPRRRSPRGAHRRSRPARAVIRRHSRARGGRATRVTATSAPAAALLGVYARVGPVFAGGDGAELIAEDGTRYLDFVAGIGVNALGYNHPVIRGAIERALATGLIHVSNLYRSEPGERLAEELVSRSFADQVFFCNSGAEANEAAFKFARKWSGKPGIVAFSGGVHGRLFACAGGPGRP